MNISEKPKKYLKRFIEWGGASSVIVFLICGQIAEAIACVIIFGILVATMEKYFP